MPEPTAGQHTAAGVATAGIEVREPVSAGAVGADDTTADDKVSAANEAASKGDVQQSIDVAQDAQEQLRQCKRQLRLEYHSHLAE